MLNGGQIVKEEEIYDVILSHQRAINYKANDAVYNYMKTRFEGVSCKDVRQAYALWKQYKLWNLDKGDDISWGVPAATIGENNVRTSVILHPDLDLVSHKDPPMTPNDSDSDSASEPASASVSKGNITTDASTAQPTSRSGHIHIFHPLKPYTILVGTSGNDGKEVWLSLLERPGKPSSYRNDFFDHRGIKRTEDQLNVIWHDAFKYSRFWEANRDKHYQMRMQRQQIFELLKEHEVQVTGQGGASAQVPKKSATRMPRQGVANGTPRAASDVGPNMNSKRRHSSRKQIAAAPRNVSSDSSDDDPPIRQAKRLKRTTMPANPVAAPTQDSCSKIGILSTRFIRPECTFDKTYTSTTDVLSSSEIGATTLLVSASNQPALAPIHVPFRKCPTNKKLFETLDTLFEELVTIGYFEGKTVSDFDMVSATYTWVEARQLMRRGNDDDWEVFLRTLEKAWKKKSNTFEEDDCKIGLLVHCKG